MLTNNYTQVSRIVIWRLKDNCFRKDEVNQDNGRFQRKFFYVCLWHVDDWCKYISIFLKIILAKLQCVFIIVRDIFNTCLSNSWFNCEDFMVKKIKLFINIPKILYFPSQNRITLGHLVGKILVLWPLDNYP